ncbi:hypothetical protein Bbelb_130630 [Branchiostoma belcheri]|nr:hypothetical protein Bbelb_130630 [Branchiostoma belcheri]
MEVSKQRLLQVFSVGAEFPGRGKQKSTGKGDQLDGNQVSQTRRRDKDLRVSLHDTQGAGLTAGNPAQVTLDWSARDLIVEKIAAMATLSLTSDICARHYGNRQGSATSGLGRGTDIAAGGQLIAEWLHL